jgi:hypothetical protein
MSSRLKAAAMNRRLTLKPEANTRRLLKILTANLQRTHDADLRELLRRAIVSLKEKQAAA